MNSFVSSSCVSATLRNFSPLSGSTTSKNFLVSLHSPLTKFWHFPGFFSDRVNGSTVANFDK
jgi:hypothetical protein